jgi:hypothetical protein
MVPSVASAAVILDFGTGTAGVGGTIADLGGGNAEGFDIYIDSLTITGHGALDGVYTVDGTPCATGGNGSCGFLSFDTVANTIVINGSVPGLGVGVTDLMAGSFSDFTFTPGTIASFIGSGTDSKSPLLLSVLGLPSTTQFTFGGFSVGFGPPTSCGETNSPCYTAISTDFVNVEQAGAIPEPGTLILLGSGLLGLARAGRRRRT